MVSKCTLAREILHQPWHSACEASADENSSQQHIIAYPPSKASFLCGVNWPPLQPPPPHQSELPFLNSLKMKMSILLGVTHMNLGIIMSLGAVDLFHQLTAPSY